MQFVAAVDPKSTVMDVHVEPLPVNPDPEIATEVPPKVGPLLGVSADTVPPSTVGGLVGQVLLAPLVKS